MLASAAAWVWMLAAQGPVAAKQAPDEARIHFQLSRLYYRLGEEKRAAEEAELSTRLRPATQPLVTEAPAILRSAPGR